MAGEQKAVEITVPASADLSKFQYRAVYLNSSGSAGTFLETWGTAATPSIGILTNKPSAAGQGARVAIQGVAKLEATLAIAAGDIVTSANAGRGSSIAPTTAYQSWVLGIAKTRAAASGDIFEVFVNPSFYGRH